MAYSKTDTGFYPSFPLTFNYNTIFKQLCLILTLCGLIFKINSTHFYI